MTKTAFVLAALAYGTQAIKLTATSTTSAQQNTCKPGLQAKQWSGWQWLSEFPKIDRKPVDTWVQTEEINWRIESDNGVYHQASDQYVVEYQGWIAIPESGEWTVWVHSDDGGQLIIDDEMIVNENKRKEFQHPKSYTGQIDAGMHKITARMFECSGWAGLKLEAKGPNFPRAVIPADAFFHGDCGPPSCVSGPICEKPIDMRWTDQIFTDYNAADGWYKGDLMKPNYQFPEQICANTPLVGVSDKVVDQRYDFIFDIVGQSNNDRSDETDFVETRFDGRKIRQISMWHHNGNEKILRNFEFRDAKGDLVYESKREWGKDENTKQVFDLADDEIICGVRGSDIHRYGGVGGYWINPQWAICKV